MSGTWPSRIPARGGQTHPRPPQGPTESTDGNLPYKHHLEQNGLDKRITTMLADPKWKDATWRKAALEAIRQAIKDAPIDPTVLDMIYKRVRLKLGGKHQQLVRIVRTDGRPQS